MSPRERRLAMAWLLLLLSTVVQAEPTPGWRFDHERSRIDFRLSALGVISLDGHFERFQGDVMPDIEQPDRFRIHLLVHADSLHMANASHRDWAKSQEFFHVRRFPSIEFWSAPVPPDLLREGGRLNGTLEIRGVRRPATFLLTASDCSTNEDVCRSRATGEIQRSQYGMRSHRISLSDRVRLGMQFVLIPIARDSAYRNAETRP